MQKQSYSVHVPGSKSITNRALLLAALCSETVLLEKALISDDTTAMVRCLETMGVKISIKADSITVSGSILKSNQKEYTLHAGLSGTVMRFLLPFLCITNGQKTLTGDDGLLKRPIGHLVESLKALGADITYLGNPGFPPLLIKQSTLAGECIEIKGNTSSQYLSSILMLLPFINAQKIKVTSNLVSKPYIDLTLKIMNDFGVFATHKNYKEFVMPQNQTYKRLEPYIVEGDISSACYFAALAILTNSIVTINNINSKSTQADRLFFDVLENMGNSITKQDNSITISGNSIKPVTIDMENFPDQVQTLAVLSSFANGVTRLSGIQTLRVKETNRVVAVTTELSKMGIKTTTTKNTLTIFGGNPKAASIDTYGDHRMAMSFALAGARLPGTVINDPHVVNKTFPEFWSKLENFGV